MYVLTDEAIMQRDALLLLQRLLPCGICTRSLFLNIPTITFLV